MLTIRGMLVGGGAALVLAARGPEVAARTGEVGSDAFPVALGALLELGLLLVCAWTVVALALAGCGGALGEAGRRLLPRALRATLLVGVAGALAVAPAQAQEGDGVRSLAAALEGLVLPDRPTSPPVAASPAPTAEPADHVVRPGDTLWDLAATELGTAASDADVAARVRVWHRTNLAVVGPDPDVLLPGQRLVVPGAGT